MPTPEGRSSPRPGPAGLRCVVVANRGPIEFDRGPDGARVRRLGSGGLATALSNVAAHLDECVWVCAALSEEDRRVAAEAGPGVVEVEEAGALHRLRLLVLDDEAFERYYSVVSNPILWFVQHGLWDLSNAPNITVEERIAFEDGYRAVNRAFADALQAVARGPEPSVVMIHDYHLYLVGEMARRDGLPVVLVHFVHIPWPQPDAWRVLPAWLRDELLLGLLGNDLVAFQTERYARNFLLCCRELLDLTVDMERSEVTVGDRTVIARAYPISVDVAQLQARAASAQVVQHERALDNIRREHLVLRVDRTDLSKNILRGFLAYDTMLERHPDLAGRVTFLALLQPSRQDVPEYAEYTDKILRLVADINLKHGNVDWQPIDLRIENNLDQAIAAFGLFDVLLVNPVSDGLNLVAKEGMLLNR
ncbi:MAG TPA: trehalose-6-phosphate synthase, partial [Acidimicrobiales bacterium]|nr:trehalose-6-phosphate synthase [Acidimicrobiales bacterium]